MNNQAEKKGLEAYGLFRMTLGIAQLVGLGFSFFLLEFVIRYPASMRLRVFKEDILALIFLAVILRGLFHLCVGIGIVRLKAWTKLWLVWAWPIVLIINAGVVYAHFHDFMEQGYVSGMGVVVSWPKLVIYLGMVLLDYVYVGPRLGQIDNETVLETLGGRFSSRQVFAAVMVVVGFFCAVLYLSQPVKQGFHRGFYKSTGQLREDAPVRKVVRPQTRASRTQGPVTAQEGPTKRIDVETQTAGWQENKTGQERVVEKVKKGKGPRAFPYQAVLAVAASALIIFGFLVQLFGLSTRPWSHNAFLLSYSFMAVGFLLGAVHAFQDGRMGLLPVTLGCFLMTAGLAGRLVIQKQEL
jgi:hypothetical protein